MNIPMKVDVYCNDGLCGHSSQLIIDPETNQVTHLVVAEKDFPHVEYMVPIAQIIDSTPDMIKLQCSIAGLAIMDPFIHINTISTDAAGMGYSSEGPRYIGSLGMGYGPRPQHDPGERFIVTVKTDATPNGEISLTRGADVYARDGKIGRLDGFLAVAGSGQITHLVMREGHLWGQKDVMIPVAQIDHMKEENVYLKLNKEQVGTLPTEAVHT